MKVLFALILLCYSQMSLAIGPLLEMKWQMPMQVRDVQEGEYDLPDYGMSSWYLYFPAPLLKLKTIVSFLILPHSIVRCYLPTVFLCRVSSKIEVIRHLV